MNILLGFWSLLAWTAMLMARGCCGGRSTSSSLLVDTTSRALDEGNETQNDNNLTGVPYCYRGIEAEDCKACNPGPFGWNGLSTCFRPLDSNPECAEGFVIDRVESTRAFAFRCDGGRNGRNIGYYQYVINTVDQDSCRATIEISLWNNSIMDPVVAEATAVVRWGIFQGESYAEISNGTYNNNSSSSSSSNNSSNPDDPGKDLWFSDDLWFFPRTTPECGLPIFLNGKGVSLSSGCPRGTNYPAWDSSSIFPAVYDGWESGVADGYYKSGVVGSSARKFHSTSVVLGALVVGVWISFG